MTPDLVLSTSLFPIFFAPHHFALAARLEELFGSQTPAFPAADDAAHVAETMGTLGLYAHLLPKPGSASLDVRSLVLIREALGQASPLADAIFAVQGLGSFPIVRAGTPDQQASWLGDIVSGKRIAAFGLTEKEAGSDVASLRTTARRDGDHWVLDGEKTLISNVPIAQHYTVFARVVGPDAPDPKKAITAFVVERGGPGVTLRSLPLASPHPLGEIQLSGAIVPASSRVGDIGKGTGLALATLDTFRISVGAAANGMAQRALTRSIEHVSRRVQFGKPLSEQQMVQAYLAEMATDLHAARLLVLSAAHTKDTAGGRGAADVAMAKMFATEAAQRTIDKAVQLHGGMGVVETTEVAHLYREIRPLRIYEGTTEIQKLLIAKSLLQGASSAT